MTILQNQHGAWECSSPDYTAVSATREGAINWWAVMTKKTGKGGKGRKGC